MKQNHPTFDKRDGGEHESMQYKTWREMGFDGLDRSISGCNLDHIGELNRLRHESKKRGERILAESYSNYAVSIVVAIH